jgi:replicative DNA helicase
MSLDLEAMRALVGESQVSVESARALLEESGACVEDVESAHLRPLWSLLEARIRARQPLDIVGIRHALAQGHADLVPIAIDVVLSRDLGVTHERLALLRDTGIRRRLVESLREVAVATKGGRPLAELEAMLRTVPAGLRGIGARVRNCSGDALAHLDKLERIWGGQGVPMLQMGMGDLDGVIGGLINNLAVIGARTGVGKSALVAGLVRNWLTAGVKVGVLAYEDDARDMQARIIACEAGVSVKHARGDLLPNEWQRKCVADGLEWLHAREKLLEVDDARPSGTASDVVASMREMAKRGCRVVLLDNMTCVRLDQDNDRRHDLLVEAALRDIRDEAQSLEIPAIVVGHLKRGQTEADESRRPPKLSDFSNAAAWENYARLALGMWRDGDEVALRVLKQTNGAAEDDFSVDFRKEAAVVTGMRQRVKSEAAPTPKRHERRQREPGDDS